MVSAGDCRGWSGAKQAPVPATTGSPGCQAQDQGGSPGGLALARELNQAHSIPPAGVLPPPKFQSSIAQPAQPASSASGRDAETSVPVY